MIKKESCGRNPLSRGRKLSPHPVCTETAGGNLEGVRIQIYQLLSHRSEAGTYRKGICMVQSVGQALQAVRDGSEKRHRPPAKRQKKCRRRSGQTIRCWRTRGRTTRRTLCMWGAMDDERDRDLQPVDGRHSLRPKTRETEGSQWSGGNPRKIQTA